jgi:GNAT superfamily N-acetyltransferase
VADGEFVTIEEVTTAGGINEFIRFPWEVYRGDPYWVPPLRSEVKFLLSAKNNPFFQHAEAACFLARKSGEAVGRIAAIIDRNHIRIHQEQSGFFGFFECIADSAVARQLLDRAAGWLKERGMEIMRGPMNPSTNEECGLLLEGFDSPPMIMMPYTPPYYLDFMELCGLTKAKDLYAYITVIGEVAAGGRLEKLAASVKARVPGLSVRPADMKRLRQELAAVKEIYNSAWSHNWGFVPMTDAERESMAKRLKPLIVPELLLMAEVNGTPAGFFMAVPDYNQVLGKLNGSLGLVGIAKSLWHSRKICDIRILTMGVKAEYRKKGIEGLLYLEAFKAAVKKGYQRAEMSWILEDNVLMQRGCELMGGRLYKKYRIYEKKISQ